jgi:hydrogenase/urease accessory protein HupE
MKKRFAALAVASLCLATPALAHRLNEYLQATTITIDGSHLILQLRLTPGVDVAAGVLDQIDTNRDGTLDEAEQHAYAQRVLDDLTLTIDGREMPLRLRDLSFPPMEQMRRGLAEIVLLFDVDVAKSQVSHHVTFENHHQKSIAAYLVNTLQPENAGIHIVSQTRTYDQSVYGLDFTVDDRVLISPAESAVLRTWLDVRNAGAILETYIWHGVRHILTGYDHLLFLGALVLGATTLWDLIAVVTSFTVAHSLTLTLAALNLVHVPERLVEPVIAASIVCVALQNVFWPEHARGRSRLAIAFLFGLFHGLGFAGGLLDVMHHMQTATVLLAILGFSIGVEVGNQMVLLPLFGFMSTVRRSSQDAFRKTNLSRLLPQVGSAAISLAGIYYLNAALVGLICHCQP